MSDVDAAAPAEEAVPAAPSMARRLNVVALWVAPASRERMEQAFLCEVTDDVDQAPLADLIVVSTRIPKVRITRVMQRLAESTLEHMQNEGLFRSLQLRAKSKMCRSKP
jgi:hypothetical protein